MTQHQILASVQEAWSLSNSLGSDPDFSTDREGGGEGDSKLTMHFDSPALQRVARDAVVLDRELRRACAVIEVRAESVPTPLPTKANALEIRSASAGSLDLWIAPTGMVLEFLLSNPIQVLLTLQALFSNGSRVLMKLRGRPEKILHDKLPTPTAIISTGQSLATLYGSVTVKQQDPNGTIFTYIAEPPS